MFTLHYVDELEKDIFKKENVHVELLDKTFRDKLDVVSLILYSDVYKRKLSKNKIESDLNKRVEKFIKEYCAVIPKLYIQCTSPYCLLYGNWSNGKDDIESIFDHQEFFDIDDVFARINSLVKNDGVKKIVLIDGIEKELVVMIREDH